MSGGTLGDVMDVRLARLVVIHDVWNGYSPDSPIAAVYELRRGRRGALSGEGRLSTAMAGERVVDVHIPSVASTRLLAAIGSARVIPGPYSAMRDRTDDYPHIEIALHVGVRAIGESSGVALLFTESQGEFHAPWGACVGGQMFSLPGDEVGKALAALRGPLKRSTLDRMMRPPSAPRPVIPAGSQWRLLELKSLSATVSPCRVVLFECTAPAGVNVPRVWCQELIDQEPWTRVEVSRVGHGLKIDLSPAEFYGLPADLIIECPTHQVIGSRWPLRSEHGQHLHALLELRQIVAMQAVDVERAERRYRGGGTR